MSKFPLLRARLIAEGLINPDEIVEPEPLTLATLALVHTQEYLAKLAGEGLSGPEQRRLGLPWSAALWVRAQLACAGTLCAAQLALDEGLAANLAGGTHHAFKDHGEGFCILNDIAVSIQKLRADGRIERALIVDLDVHQGNGTAAIFAADPAVFTFSMHGEHNYPLQKVQSSLDVALPTGAGDAHYLTELAANLPRAIRSAQPDLAFYVAGVDVAAGDRYGKLELSDAGIRRRDLFVIESVRSQGVPLVIVLGGGYAPTRERTAELHTQVFRAAADFERRPGSGALAFNA